MGATLIFLIVGFGLVYLGAFQNRKNPRPLLAAFGGALVALACALISITWDSETKLFLVDVWQSFLVWCTTAFKGSVDFTVFTALVVLVAVGVGYWAKNKGRVIIGMIAAVFVFALLLTIFPNAPKATSTLAQAWFQEFLDWVRTAFSNK